MRTITVREAASRLPELFNVVATMGKHDDMDKFGELLAARQKSRAWLRLLSVFAQYPAIMKGASRGASNEQIVRACVLLAEGYRRASRRGR